jgi:hypothetical protein
LFEKNYFFPNKHRPFSLYLDLTRVYQRLSFTLQRSNAYSMISPQSTVVADSASSFYDTKINKKISIQSNVDVIIDLLAYIARVMYFRDIYIDYVNKKTLLK